MASSSIDVFVLVTPENFLRIQVKSSSKPIKINDRPVLSYTFSGHRHPGKEVDAFAFVALDIRAIIFTPPEVSFSKRFTVDSFLKESRGSIDRFLKSRNLW